MSELDLLKKPEYIHVLLNHLPIYGTILGALALAISLVLRSRTAQITALILILIAGASAYPVFVTGQRSYKTIRGVSDDAGADWLDEHMDRAEKTIGAFYFLAALAIAGLLVPIKWPKSAVPLAALTLVAAILCSGIAVYIAQPGGRVRHPEFRPGENPTPISETDHNESLRFEKGGRNQSVKSLEICERCRLDCPMQRGFIYCSFFKSADLLSEKRGPRSFSEGRQMNAWRKLSG